MSHLEAGKLRALAAVGAERIPVLPNLQTALEQGYKSLQIESTFGIVVPPKASGPSLTACGRRSDLP